MVAIRVAVSDDGRDELDVRAPPRAAASPPRERGTRPRRPRPGRPWRGPYCGAGACDANLRSQTGSTLKNLPVRDAHTSVAARVPGEEHCPRDSWTQAGASAVALPASLARLGPAHASSRTGGGRIRAPRAAGPGGRVPTRRRRGRPRCRRRPRLPAALRGGRPGRSRLRPPRRGQHRRGRRPAGRRPAPSARAHGRAHAGHRRPRGRASHRARRRQRHRGDPDVRGPVLGAHRRRCRRGPSGSWARNG